MEEHVTAVRLLAGQKGNGRHLGVMKEPVIQAKTTMSAKIKIIPSKIVIHLPMELGVLKGLRTRCYVELVVLRIQVLQ